MKDEYIRVLDTSFRATYVGDATDRISKEENHKRGRLDRIFS